MVRLGDLADVKYGKANPNSSGNIPVIGSGGVFAWTDKPLVDYPTEEKRKAALQTLFKTMLHQLMTGQIRVNAAG